MIENPYLKFICFCLGQSIQLSMNNYQIGLMVISLTLNLDLVRNGQHHLIEALGVMFVDLIRNSRTGNVGFDELRDALGDITVLLGTIRASQLTIRTEMIEMGTEMRTEMRAEMTEIGTQMMTQMRAEMTQIGTQMRTEMRTEMRAEMTEIGTQMMTEMRAEMRADMTEIGTQMSLLNNEFRRQFNQIQIPQVVYFREVDGVYPTISDVTRRSLRLTQFNRLDGEALRHLARFYGVANENDRLGVIRAALLDHMRQ